MTEPMNDPDEMKQGTLEEIWRDRFVLCEKDLRNATINLKRRSGIPPAMFAAAWMNIGAELLAEAAREPKS